MSSFTHTPRNLSDFLDKQLDILFLEAVARNKHKRLEVTGPDASSNICKQVSFDTTVSDEVLRRKQIIASPAPSDSENCHSVCRSQSNPEKVVSHKAHGSQQTSHTCSSCTSPVKSERISTAKETVNRHNLPVSPVRSIRNHTVVSDARRVGNGEEVVDSSGTCRLTKKSSCELEKSSRNINSPVKSSRKSSHDLKSECFDEVACSPAKSARNSCGTNEQTDKIKRKIEGEVIQKLDAVKSKRTESNSRFIYEIKCGSSISREKNSGSKVQKSSDRVLPDSKSADNKINSNLVAWSSKRRKVSDNDGSAVRSSKIIDECLKTMSKSKRNRQCHNILKQAGMNTASSQERNSNVPNSMQYFKSCDDKTDINSSINHQIRSSKGNESKKGVLKADLENAQISELDCNPRSVTTSALCQVNQNSKEDMMNDIHHENAQFSGTQTMLGDSHVHSSNNQITSVNELDDIIPLVKTRSGTVYDKPIWNSILSHFES